MARKQAQAIQDTVETNEDLAAYLQAKKDVLVCLEVYSEFCGHCLATSFAIRKGKLEIGGDQIAMVKDGKLTRAMFGANGIRLCTMIQEELELIKEEKETGALREKIEISDLLPEERAKVEEDRQLEEEYKENLERLRTLTLAARKKRVNERRAMKLRRLNFIMFWPSCHQAHYDLYEKWDMINVQVAAKEYFQLTPETAKEALYMSDVDPNEACLYELMKGEVLVVLFKMFDTDMRDFVQLMRYTLYEEIPVMKEDVPPEKRIPPIPAYERYATISKSAREVRRDRYNAKLAKLAAEKEERDRLAAEQARLKREAEEEQARIEKQRQEEERMARIAAGLPAEPEPAPAPEPEPPSGEQVEGEEAVQGEGEIEGEREDKADTEVTETTATEVTEAEPKGEEEKKLEELGDEAKEEGLKDEEKVEEEEEFHSDIEVEDEEYIPPGGLFVPGLYSPPNDLAKANGLNLFYPKQVRTVDPTEESEYLPPHVLVIFGIDKRYDVQEVLDQYPNEILNVGVFVGEDPYTAEHVAYTIKQYDKMVRLRKHLDRLAVMVSRKRSLPLLQLAGLSPVYISADVDSGEKECLAMFPVGYADDYEEPESVKEEEEVEIAATPATPPPPEGEITETPPPEGEAPVEAEQGDAPACPLETEPKNEGENVEPQ